jgi:hypothetical protein
MKRAVSLDRYVFHRRVGLSRHALVPASELI